MPTVHNDVGTVASPVQAIRKFRGRLPATGIQRKQIGNHRGLFANPQTHQQRNLQITIGPGIIPGFSYLCFEFDLFIEKWKTHGCVVKCGRGFFMPDLAYYGRFGGISRKSGPMDHPAVERPVKRKFVKNNGIDRAMVIRDFRTTKDDYLMAGNKTLKNYENIFGN